MNLKDLEKIITLINEYDNIENYHIRVTDCWDWTIFHYDIEIYNWDRDCVKIEEVLQNLENLLTKGQ